MQCKAHRNAPLCCLIFIDIGEISIEYKRILIIGCSGAGKSTLARQLGALTQLPVLHLDRLYWQPNWTKTDKPLFIQKLLHELEKPCWIIDGNFDSTLDLRMQYADCVIFLDYATHTCIRRVLWRYATNIGRTRIDMTEGCTEKIDIEFLQWIARYQQDARPHVVEQLINCPIPSIVLQHPKQTKAWLASITHRMN